MELLIKIPEEEYKRMKEKRMFGNVTTWKDAICNGTPLPKGHGRLIDADKIWDLYHDYEYDFYEAFNDVATIIEANEEGAEE